MRSCCMSDASARAARRPRAAAGALAGVLLTLLVAGCSSPGGRAVDAGPGYAERQSAAAVARYEAALEVLTSGRSDLAMARFEALVADYPQYTGPRRQLAWLMVEEGDLSGGRALLEEARALCVHCAPLLTDLGLVQRQLGDFTAARASYLEAVEVAPDHAPAHFNLAVLYELYLDRPRDAMAHYERYLELEPTDAQAGSIRAWIAQLERQMDAAASTARIGDLP